MPEQDRRRRTKPEPWTFTRVGSYGTFSSAGSLPIEYLQTTFSHGELNRLALARDVRPDRLDFEMLMQRDIDEGRAETSLREYLNPRGSTPADMERYSVFFPPLLIACVPCEDNTIRQRYPDETWEVLDDGRLVRRWGDMFQLEYYTTGWVQRHELRSPDSDLSASIDLTNVEAKFNLSAGTEHGVKLIAIDGQHRLHALKTLLGHRGGVISDLIVPTCILFSTSASDACKAFHARGSAIELPSVPETFRKVFVDVNSKMERVGAHTNILLNDTNIGSLIVREFCSAVNERDGFELSAVEWNVRSIKDSTQLTRVYSITSIGILEKALKECFEKSEPLMRRLLDIQDVSVEQELKDAADDPDDPDIAWTSFSIAQRRILAGRVKGGTVALLYRVFFELDPYAQAFHAYRDELQRWAERGAENKEDSHDHQAAFDALTTFQTPKQSSGAFPIVRRLERQQREWRVEHICPVMGLALFQRSIILTLRELLDALSTFRIQPVSSGLMQLLARAMDSRTALFAPTRSYALKTIWHESGSIVNRDSTRRQFTRLTLAMCGGSDTANVVATAIEPDDELSESVVERLRSLGEEKASEYWQRFVMDRQNYFARTFLTNLGLDQGEVDSLKQAKADQDAQTEMVRAGEMEEDDAQKPFDRAVRQHLKDDFIQAEEQLRKILQFDSHIVGPDFFEDEVDEE